MTSFRERVSQGVGNARRRIGQSIGVVSNFVTGMRTTRGHRINPIANSNSTSANRTRRSIASNRSNASIRRSNASNRSSASNRSKLTLVNSNSNGKLKSRNRTFFRSKISNKSNTNNSHSHISRIEKSNRFDNNDIRTLTELIHLFNRSNEHGKNIYAINALLKGKNKKIEDKVLSHLLNFFPIYEKNGKKYLTSKSCHMFLIHITKHSAMLDQWKIFMDNMIHLIENNLISDDGILHIRKFCDFWEETITSSNNKTEEWLLDTCRLIREKIN